MSTQRLTVAVTALVVLAGCGKPKEPSDPQLAGQYVLGSVVIDTDGNRTTYVQTVPSLEGPFNNKTAIELPGNGVLIAGEDAFFIGLAEEPTWVRYSVNSGGVIAESGRLSFLNLGAKSIDYGNAYVDAQTAVSVLSDPPMAVIWNPTTMEIRGEVDLSGLARGGYGLEVWTTVTHGGKVYIPGRWADWEGGRIFPAVSLTVLDPYEMKVLGTAYDERCASGGRVVFGADGYAYVMGDGRNYSIHMYANAAGTTAPDNCLLRMAPGQIAFEKDYFYTLPSLTGGRQSITELETAANGSGFGFAKMFYPDQLPSGVKADSFDFWGERAHKMWRIRLANPPVAEEVEGIPFSTIGFEGAMLDGRLYSGESLDNVTSDVYEIDPNTNRATLRFKMDGYFNGLYKLKKNPT